MDKRNYLISVWRDTVEKCESGKFSNLILSKSILYYQNDWRFKDIIIENKIKQTKISIMNEDVLVVAKMLYDKGENNILVLNLASWQISGGGVRNGSMAQEEELFRRTNYFKSFDNQFHPLKKGEIVYTPKVFVIKDKYYNDLSNPFNLSMLASAAIMNPILTDNNKFNNKDYVSMCQIIENIFKVSILTNHKVLILGGIGCGAYGCPPEEVAKIFNIYLKKYNGYFETIIFAILSKNDDNFNIFEKIIEK